MPPSLPLFDEENEPQQLQLRDADIRFIRRFHDEDTAARHFSALRDEIAWRQESITLWGKPYAQPRLTAWYGDAGTNYSYSGLRLEPLPWTPCLAAIKAEIEAFCGERFNSVLANLYRNERDSVGWHSDDEPELGKQPFIASMSFGATRTFKLKHKSRKDEKPAVLELGSGSLLLMGGSTQRHWLHAVEKEREACGPRINLTFRTIRC
ncbi:MAG TPA: alpha-ketoglutarate-dependent dioxygenase AlkB [Burkholderiaceae bacterium]